jgi:hypothetical protein
VTLWNTSNHKVAKISALGHVTAMGAGTVNIDAMIGSIPANVWTMTVTAGAASTVAAQAAPADATEAASATAAR